MLHRPRGARAHSTQPPHTEFPSSRLLLAVCKTRWAGALSRPRDSLPAATPCGVPGGLGACTHTRHPLPKVLMDECPLNAHLVTSFFLSCTRVGCLCQAWRCTRRDSTRPPSCAQPGLAAGTGTPRARGRRLRMRWYNTSPPQLSVQGYRNGRLASLHRPSTALHARQTHTPSP